MQSFSPGEDKEILIKSRKVIKKHKKQKPKKILLTAPGFSIKKILSVPSQKKAGGQYFNEVTMYSI